MTVVQDINLVPVMVVEGVVLGELVHRVIQTAMVVLDYCPLSAALLHTTPAVEVVETEAPVEQAVAGLLYQVKPMLL
jgi:hypothetical protein